MAALVYGGALDRKRLVAQGSAATHIGTLSGTVSWKSSGGIVPRRRILRASKSERARET
jgi:hypothetical protein